MKKKLFRLRITESSFFSEVVILKNLQLFFKIGKVEKIFNIFNFIKYSFTVGYNYLIDIVACDYLAYKKRFKICYVLRPNINFYIINVYVNIPLLGKLISIFKIFKSCIWMEREIYDMFGLIFFNNWDLRRIINDYTFFGFPLRKDFPLTGFVELIYDIKKKCTFETLLELMQELRFYILASSIEFWDMLK